MTLDKLDKLERLEREATPGPWRQDDDGYLVGPDGENIHWDHEGLGATWGNDTDAALIVIARNALPGLIAVARAAAAFAALRALEPDA